MREDGASQEDLQNINSRVVCSENGIRNRDIPKDAVYATSTNKDKSAINDGL